MEQKEAASTSKAAMLSSSHEKSFLAIHSTFHPSGTPGEIAGKSANVAYAARKAMERYGVFGKCDHLVFTVMDGAYTVPFLISLRD
jgi:hypothetical protein